MLKPKTRPVLSVASASGFRNSPCVYAICSGLGEYDTVVVRRNEEYLTLGRITLNTGKVGLSRARLATGLGRGQRQERAFPQETYCALRAQIQDLIPAAAEVTVLGDGEFDGTAFQAALRKLKLRLLARCLKDDIPIPEGFLVPVRLPSKPMRQLIKQAV